MTACMKPIVWTVVAASVWAGVLHARLYPAAGFSNEFRMYMASLPGPVEYSGELVIKFWNGRGVTLATSSPPRFAGTEPRWQEAVGAMNAVLGSCGVASAQRAFSRPAADLDAERLAAKALSGADLPDLNAFFFLTLPEYGAALSLLASLQSNPVCEIAYMHPRPPPLPSPSFITNQAYLLPAASNGYDALYAWAQPGGGGTQVKLIDIEYDWYLPHEDLNKGPADFLCGFQTNLFGTSRDHGTAALGISAALSNSYGMQGMVFAATTKVGSAVDSNGTWRLNDAINVCVTCCVPGDVILLEQQAYANSMYCPVEYWALFYAAIVNATAAGRIIIEPAGNGSADLDNAVWAGIFQRSYRDSMAIMVGAGTAAGRDRCSFSDYGSRLDIQGWGDWSVASLGYGDLAGSVLSNQYTRSFSGTSSASALSAGAAASVQSFARARGGSSLSPAALRANLVQNGRPQTFGLAGSIGPLPNLRASLMAVAAPPPFVDITNGTMNVLVPGPCSLAGTNNGTVVGTMWIYHTGNSGLFSFAATDSWLSPGVVIDPDTNWIEVYGSNLVGQVTNDTVLVIGVPEAGGRAALALAVAWLTVCRRPVA